MQLNKLFDSLWQQYVSENPQTQKIHDLFVNNGEVVVNDHVAFRTFDDARVNVATLGKLFENLGYKMCGEYEFTAKKLFARHYEHIEDSNQPKVFISELKTKEFSPFLQKIATACVDAIPESMLNSQNILHSGCHWHDLDYDV